MPYQNLNHALKLFRQQVSESIPYAQENFPALSSPQAVFNYLKPRTTYKKDPKGRELFQHLQTLMEGSRVGIPGAGDCDCFTIAALATLLANGFTDCGIVLVGRKPSPFPPVHIYAYVDDQGERKYLDLTNRMYNYERDYLYKQHVPYKVNQEEQNMILELAEGGLSRRGGHLKNTVNAFTGSKTAKRFTNSKFGKRLSNTRIAREAQRAINYIPLQSGVNVREDYYDGMSAAEFQNTMLSEGLDPMQIMELSSKRSDRKAARVSARMQKRAMKPRNVRKLLKQQSKAQARLNNSLNPNYVSPMDKIIGGVTKVAGAVFNKGGGGQSPDDDDSQPDDGSSYNTDDTQSQYTPPDDQDDDTPMEEGFVQPLLWGLGIAAAGIAAGIIIKKVRKHAA